MKQLFLLLTLAGGLNSIAMAAPCGMGTLADYINLGGGGCSLGSIQVFNFDTAPGLNFGTPIDPGTVLVNPNGGGLRLELDEQAEAGDLLDLFFRFNVSHPSLVGSFIKLRNANTSGDGLVTVIQDVCAAGSFDGNQPMGCTGESGTAAAVLAQDVAILNAGNTFAPSSFFDVFTEITLDGGGSGRASAGTVDLAIVATPEPSVWMLMGSGLAGLALWRRRQR